MTDTNDCDREKYLEPLQYVGGACPGEFYNCTGFSVHDDCWFYPEMNTTSGDSTWHACPDSPCLTELFTAVDLGEPPAGGSDTMMDLVNCFLDHEAELHACPYVHDGYCDEGEACPYGTDPDDCQAEYDDYMAEAEAAVAGENAALANCTQCPDGFVQLEPCHIEQHNYLVMPSCDLDNATDGTAECPMGCWLSYEYAPACDLDWMTDYDFGEECPPGCDYYPNLPNTTGTAICNGTASVVPAQCSGHAQEVVVHEWYPIPPLCVNETGR